MAGETKHLKCKPDRHSSAPLLTLLVLVVALMPWTLDAQATNSIPSENTENALIEIEFSLKNIAVNADRNTESLGYGAAMTITKPSFSDSREGLFDPSFSHKGIRACIEKRKHETISGRTAFIHYAIKNMPFTSASLGTNRLLPVFECDWYRHRLDYGFIGTNGIWRTGTYLPISYLSDTPSKATIYGVGEADIYIPGYNIQLLPPKSIQDIDKVEEGIDFKVVTSKQWIRRCLCLDVLSLKRKVKDGERLVLEGRAILGDSLIETKRRPFWYPWDKYEIAFTFMCGFPADVRISLNDVEDLDVERVRQRQFVIKEPSPVPLVFSLKRRNPWRGFLLRDAAAFFPLLFLNGGLFKRIFSYCVPVGALVAALPVPLNVPVVCLQNIVVFGLLLIVVICVELRLFRERQRKEALGQVQPPPTALPPPAEMERR